MPNLVCLFLTVFLTSGARAQLSGSNSRPLVNDACEMIGRKIDIARFYMMASKDTETVAYGRAVQDLPFLMKDVEESCRRRTSCRECERDVGDLKEKLADFTAGFGVPEVEIERIKNRLNACGESHIKQLKLDLVKNQKLVRSAGSDPSSHGAK